MWPSHPGQPGYPYSHQPSQQQQQPPPPLPMPTHPQQPHHPYEPQPPMQPYQQSPYDMPSTSTPVPPSPREEAGRDRDVDYSNLPGPPATHSTWHGRSYVLEWVQQPVRARMCGFGDKDRRPISPPPCIRLRVIDNATNQEIDPDLIEISYFVLTVDLWDKEGQNEKNLVKHAQVSPSISTATTSAYPTTVTYGASLSHPLPVPYEPTNLPGYQESSNTQSNTGYGYPPNTTASSGQSQMYGNQYNAPGYGGAQGGYGMQQANEYNIPPISSFGSSMASPYGQSRRGYREDDINSPQTTGMFTRNLIGSLSTSASLLKDDKNQRGIWFILQDLSVRTEDWFRLKASFVSLGVPAANPAMQGQDSQMLTKGTAPVLATIFSKPFQVFSAKKFPGVIESTELSKKFAQQGVKIPIRKENGGKARRGSDDGDDIDED